MHEDIQKTRTVSKAWLDEFTFLGGKAGRGGYCCIVMLSSMVEKLVHANADKFVNNMGFLKYQSP